MLLKNKSSIIYHLIIIFLIAGYGGYRIFIYESISTPVMNFVYIIISAAVLAGFLFLIYLYKSRKSKDNNMVKPVLCDFLSMMLMLAWLYIFSLLICQEDDSGISTQTYLSVSSLILIATAVASALYHNRLTKG